MAKTYEELEKMGWRRRGDVWFHTDNSLQNFEQQKGEWDAEFRERLERATPGYVNHPVVLAAEIRAARFLLERKQRELAELEERFKHANKWDLWLGNLNVPHVKFKAITWTEVLTEIAKPIYGITAQNWSGLWQAHLYRGTKKSPHDILMGMVCRTNWQEIDL